MCHLPILTQVRFYKNMFYKNIEAEICKMLSNDILSINLRLEKNIILCFQNLYIPHKMCFLVKR